MNVILRISQKSIMIGFEKRRMITSNLIFKKVFLHASLTRDLKLSPLGTFTLKTSAFSNFDLRMSYSKLLNASSKRSGSIIYSNQRDYVMIDWIKDY